MAKFNLGSVVGTPGAVRALEKAGKSAGEFISRHAACDWGEMSEGDKKLNDQAVKDGERLMSAYSLPGGEKIWVITEWDRSVTTVLLPEEY